MILTFFSDYAAAGKREADMSLVDLAALVETTSAPSKSMLPWLKPGRFGDARSKNGSLRTNDNVVAITGVAADYDGEKMSVDEAVDRLDKAGIDAIVYTSPSHRPEAPRWRVVCPFAAELPPSEHGHMVARVNGVVRRPWRPRASSCHSRITMARSTATRRTASRSSTAPRR
jgi:hypothetical protein